MTRSMRRGVTLFQLLIVLVILVLLVALLLPATVHLRMAAGRSASQNNLKQIGISIHAYYDTNGSFMAGVNKENFSVHAHILPYIEQDNLYKLIDFKKPATDDANANVRKSRVKVFLSPVDPAMPMTEDGPTNYLFNAGTLAALEKNDGMFFAGSKLTFPNVTDGTSNTIMAGETLRGDGGVRAMTVARQHVRLKEDALKGIKAEVGVLDWKNDDNIAADRGGRWIEGRFLQTVFTATRPINDDKPDVDCGGAGGLSALRTPVGTFNTAFMDGSVRAIKANVDFVTWRALCTRSGGEVVSID